MVFEINTDYYVEIDEMVDCYLSSYEEEPDFEDWFYDGERYDEDYVLASLIKDEIESAFRAELERRGN